MFRFAIIGAILCLAAAASAQTDSSYVRIFQGKGKISERFIDGKTTVIGVEYVGLDVDQEDYGIFIEIPIYEKNFVSELRLKKIEINELEPFEGYKVHRIERFLEDWLDQRGYPFAKIEAQGQSVGESNMRLRFMVERGQHLTSSAFVFHGNERVSSGELTEAFEGCSKGRGFDKRMYDYCAQKEVRPVMWSKGFLNARINNLSYSLRGTARVVTISITEGPRFRLGGTTIKGNKALSDHEIMALVGQVPGEVFDGRRIQRIIYEELRLKYAKMGYIQFGAEWEPDLIDPVEKGSDGIVNQSILIDEGPRFLVRKIVFTGLDELVQKTLLSEFPLKSGDIFVQSDFDAWIDQLNKSGKFHFVDKHQDVAILTDDEAADLDLIIKIKSR